MCETSLPVLSSSCLELTAQKLSFNSDSATVFNPLLPGFLTFLVSVAHCMATAPLKLRPYGAVQICLSHVARVETVQHQSVANWGTLKMRDMKLRDMKMRHQNARVENARHENAAPECRGGKCET